METERLIYGIIALVIIILVLSFIYYRYIRTIKEAKQNNDNVHDFRGKFERKKYVFHNGLKCCQEQLDLDQNEEYSKLLSSANINDAGEIDFLKLNEILYHNKGMRKLLAVILINNDGSKLTAEQVKLLIKLKDEEVEAVLNDFFTLNPQKKLQFEILKLSAVSLTKLETRKADMAITSQH